MNSMFCCRYCLQDFDFATLPLCLFCGVIQKDKNYTAIATTLLKSLSVSENFMMEAGVKMSSYMTILGA